MIRFNSGELRRLAGETARLNGRHSTARSPNFTKKDTKLENYFDRFIMKGGVMMIFLIPTSIIALTLIIHGLIDLRRSRMLPRRVIDAFQMAGDPPSMAAVRTNLERAPDSPLKRVCMRLLPWVGMRGERWDMTVQQVTSEETAALYQRHNYLAVVYGVAPLMVLLGTILGMIRTFYEFSQSQSRSVDELSQGINEALVTTMWGLIIAVPAYLFVSLFRQRLYRYENDRIPSKVRDLFAPLSEAIDQEAEKPASPRPAGRTRTKPALPQPVEER